MTNNIKLFGTASGVAIALLGANPAYASGTLANTDILNTATVNYQVNNIAQTAVQASDTLKVDRKVTVSVVELGNVTTSVTLGQAQAATAFTVTNSSNAAIDIGLTATNFVGTAAPHGGTDSFNPGAYTFYVETGTTAGFDATDTLVTFLDELAADATRTVYVVTSIPAAGPPTNLVNGQIAAVHLTGTAKENGGTGTEGAAITATGGANGKNVLDTVLLDAAGTAPGDAANDGKSSDDDDYTIQAPLLTVTKFSRIIEDPVNTIISGNAANAKAIPGATIEYCITVANGTGGATATNVNISDSLATLPVTYLSAFGVQTEGTVSGGVCSGATGTGTFASNAVSGTLNSIAAGTTKSLYFRATIN